MRIADLTNRRVAIWGFGREGRAAIHALRQHCGNQDFTLFCSAAEVDAASASDAALNVVAGEPDAATLGRFDVVVKSPGISAYKPALLEAQAQGTRFTSGRSRGCSHPTRRVRRRRHAPADELTAIAHRARGSASA